MADSIPIISVIIVNYNAGELLAKAVSAILRSSVPLEVLVSDNGSSDSSLEILDNIAADDARLKIIKNGKNLGFSRANNLAIGLAKGEYILLLNPDCIIQQDTLEIMLGALANEKNVGMAGCLVLNLDGSEQAGCRRRIPTPWRSLVKVLHIDKIFPKSSQIKSFVLAGEPLPSSPVYVDAISGSFMFVRREAIDQVGVLDEEYFMHCEDLDWCMRFLECGWKILFVPGTQVLHYKSQSSKSRPFFVEWHKHKGMVRYYKKFFRHKYHFGLMTIVALSVWLRFILVCIRLYLSKLFSRIRLARE